MRLHRRLSPPDHSPSENRPRERQNRREGDEHPRAFPCEVVGRNLADACERRGESYRTLSRAVGADGTGKEWGRKATSSADGEAGPRAYRCTWVASEACKGDGGDA